MCVCALHKWVVECAHHMMVGDGGASRGEQLMIGANSGRHVAAIASAIISLTLVLPPVLPLGLKRTEDTGGDCLSKSVFKQWPVCVVCMVGGSRGCSSTAHIL